MGSDDKQGFLVYLPATEHIEFATLKKGRAVPRTTPPLEADASKLRGRSDRR